MLICFSPSGLDPAAARDWQEGMVKKPSRIHGWFDFAKSQPHNRTCVLVGTLVIHTLGVEERIRLNRTFGRWERP